MKRPLTIATTLALCLLTQPAASCDLALALTMDVSGSIDPGEYAFQVEGLAKALEDPTIIDALVQSQVALSVIQWSGAGEHEVSIPWRRMLSREAVAGFAQQAGSVKRRWSDSKTAVGDAIAFSASTFATVPDCRRKVIDVSGDGMTNSGSDTVMQRNLARGNGITINGLAIDRVGKAITQFYRNFVATGENSFVLTATGYSDYPRAIRLKLFSEIVKPTS